VVLLDYQLPEIDGLAVGKLVDELMGRAARPILIALTATPDVLKLKVKESGAESAFDAIVGKSCDLTNLFSAIARLALATDRAQSQTARFSLFARDWLEYDVEPHRTGAQGDAPGPARILVVEDDESQRRLLTFVLQGRGYVVETASGGLEAFLKMRTGCYDLALVDYHLPEIDGLAAGCLISEMMRSTVRPRLIALTATPALLRDREGAAGTVFDEIVDKSSDLQGLLSAVDRLLRSAPNPNTRWAAECTVPTTRAA
jgi:CheY-like chemotaxis protein